MNNERLSTVAIVIGYSTVLLSAPVILVRHIDKSLMYLDWDYQGITTSGPPEAIERMLSVLPASTTLLRARYGIDDHDYWVKFTIDADELPLLRSRLDQLIPEAVAERDLWFLRDHYHRSRPPWWPWLLTRRHMAQYTDRFPFFIGTHSGIFCYRGIDMEETYYFFVNPGNRGGVHVSR